MRPWFLLGCRSAERAKGDCRLGSCHAGLLVGLPTPIFRTCDCQVELVPSNYFQRGTRHDRELRSVFLIIVQLISTVTYALFLM